jgi:hypothetical protein
MRVLTLLITLMLSFAVNAEDSYLCVAENATGFQFDEDSRSWDAGNLGADGFEFLVKPIEMNSERYRIGYRNVVQDIGNNGAEVAFCKQGSDVYGSLNCGEPRDPYRFSIRKETMRFIATFNGAYLTSTREIFVEGAKVRVEKVPDKGGDAPYLLIGSCSAL